VKRYRRIEINASRRRVTIVSGEWPRDSFEAQTAQTDDGVSLNDSDSCEPLAPDSSEGQLILVEAMRSLERRLLPETRSAISSVEDTICPSHSNSFYGKLKSLCEFICQGFPTRLRRSAKQGKEPEE